MNPLSLSSLSDLTKETVLISRLEYFYTQIRVLWMYIGQFFWPGALHLDHDISISHSLYSPDVLIGLLAHLFVLLTAVVCARREPIISFALLFFYLAHSVESSFIPIRDVLFEHRTYLPNLGLCILTGWTLIHWIPRLFGKKIQPFIIVAICLLLTSITWARNLTWTDPLKLWHDSAIHAPDKARPWSELGNHLSLKGNNIEALEIFLQVMGKSQKINETGAKPPRLDETASINLVLALSNGKEYELALLVANQLLPQHLSKLNRSKLLNNKGNILYKLHQPLEAEKAYREALRIFEKNYVTMNNLSYILVMQDRLDEAEKMLAMIPKTSPTYSDKNKILATIEKKRKAQ